MNYSIEIIAKTKIKILLDNFLLNKLISLNFFNNYMVYHIFNTLKLRM